MSDLRFYSLELASGRTIAVRFRRLRDEDRGLELRDGILTTCDSCAGERVQLVACGFARHGRVDCERRCPECGRRDDGAWSEAALAHYASRLRHELEDVERTVVRREAERVEQLVHGFAQALADGLLQADDFAP